MKTGHVLGKQDSWSPYGSLHNYHFDVSKS